MGNHEFDSGPRGLLPFLQAVNFPVLAANLELNNEPELKIVKKSVVLDVNGVQVGVIGYLTPDTVQISQTRGVIFQSEVSALTKESERLDKEGVKIIIALGHSGFLMDQEIARKVPLVDVVIGGHTNTFQWTGTPPDIEKPEDMYPKIIIQKSGKKVPVVQAYAYTKYMGVLNTTFNSNGDLVNFVGQPILLDHTVPQDQDILNNLDRYREEINQLSKMVIATTKVLLDGNANVCRQMECNFGNLLADALVQYVASLTSGKFWTKAPIGLVNGGGIRNSIEPGNITRAELIGVMPFDNRIVTLELTGADLLKTLEIGARSNGETSMGEFLQVSGLKYTVDRRQPPMSRIVHAEARCSDCLIPRYKTVDPKQNYTVVTFSFLSEGGDGHTILKEKGFNKRIEDLNDVDMVHWYLKKYSPVYPEVQGRITIIEKDVPDSGCALIQVNFNILFILIIMMLTFINFIS